MHADQPPQPASSAFTPVPPQLGQVSNLPEIALFSQLAPFYQQQASQPGGLTQQQLQLYQQLQLSQLQTMQQAAQPQQTKSESKSSSAYASRHQAAEQRRRNRINERLDKLRTLVPHAERANTASFLEEVIHYIEELQALLKCGPNHATGAPATYPSAALAAAVQQQQQQRQPQAPLDLSGLVGRGDLSAQQHAAMGSLQQAQQGALQLPVSTSGMYTPSAGPYGVATPNGGFEVLHPQHPSLAGLHASIGQAGMQQVLPPQLQQQQQHAQQIRPPTSYGMDVAAAPAAGEQPAGKSGNDPSTPPPGAASTSPPSGASEDNSEGRPLKKRQRGGQAAA